MSFGNSLFLIALGAIFRFAIDASVAGVRFHTLGVILIVVGFVGLLLSVLWATRWSDRRAHEVAFEREVPLRTLR